MFTVNEFKPKPSSHSLKTHPPLTEFISSCIYHQLISRVLQTNKKHFLLKKSSQNIFTLSRNQCGFVNQYNHKHLSASSNSENSATHLGSKLSSTPGSNVKFPAVLISVLTPPVLCPRRYKQWASFV